jgi:hypothetical protein
MLKNRLLGKMRKKELTTPIEEIIKANSYVGVIKLSQEVADVVVVSIQEHFLAYCMKVHLKQITISNVFYQKKAFYVFDLSRVPGVRLLLHCGVFLNEHILVKLRLKAR